MHHHSILAEWDVPPASLVANLIHEWMDLLNPIFVYLLLGLILEGQPHLVFVPTTTVWCCWCGVQQVRGNVFWNHESCGGIAVVAWQSCRQSADCHRLSRRCTGSSLMLESSPCQSMEKETRATKAYRDQCRDGAPWRKSACITSNHLRIVAINGSCPGAQTT